MDVLLIIIILYGVLIVGMLIYCIIFPPIFTVPEQQAVVIEQLGKYYRVFGPGLHFLFPFIEQKRKFIDNGKVVDYVDQRERSVDLPAHVFTTKDNIQIRIESIAYYEISDPKRAVYGVDDVFTAVNTLLLIELRKAIATMDLKDIRPGRELVNRRVRDQVENSTSDWGVTLRSIELKAIKTETFDLT